MKTGLMIAPMLLLEACGGSTIERRANEASPRQADGPAQPAPPASTAREPVLDPKSSGAAEQLVRNFAGLLAAGKFDEAYMLLGPQAPPRREFIEPFHGYTDLRLKVGAAGFQEGAAGSVYVSVPLSISGRNGGGRLTRNADVVLRRVNDVPGSTEAQRHWHIQRLDWHG